MLNLFFGKQKALTFLRWSLSPPGPPSTAVWPPWPRARPTSAGCTEWTGTVWRGPCGACKGGGRTSSCLQPKSFVTSGSVRPDASRCHDLWTFEIGCFFFNNYPVSRWIQMDPVHWIILCIVTWTLHCVYWCILLLKSVYNSFGQPLLPSQPQVSLDSRNWALVLGSEERGVSLGSKSRVKSWELCDAHRDHPWPYQKCEKWIWILICSLIPDFWCLVDA